MEKALKILTVPMNTYKVKGSMGYPVIWRLRDIGKVLTLENALNCTEEDVEEEDEEDVEEFGPIKSYTAAGKPYANPSKGGCCSGQCNIF